MSQASLIASPGALNAPLLKRFTCVRAFTEKLCEPLTVEDYSLQVVAYASPPKWHLAHVTWFFETFLLKPHLSHYRVYDENFDYLFNSYYQTVGERLARAHRGLLSRPSVEEVYAYRKHVDAYMREFIEQCDDSALQALVELGIQHEQQHQELLLTDLKYVFSCNPLKPAYNSSNHFHASSNTGIGWVAIPEGVYEIGHEGDTFCFDNEQARHKTYLNAFEINTALVTNGEYLKFIQDGGYQNFEYWLDDGWSWVQENKVQHPLYWQHEAQGWQVFTLAGLQALNTNSIATHISFYEAHAFATWKNMRLPTEQEWEVAAAKINWGDRWEWTSSAYQPYPGFKISEGAIGEYNGKFMVNQMVLRGASVATAPNHSRATYRNFFHPHLQWQYSAIRLVK